jgi:hypothetical protein
MLIVPVVCAKVMHCPCDHNFIEIQQWSTAQIGSSSWEVRVMAVKVGITNGLLK